MPRFLKRFFSNEPVLAVVMISLTALITHGLLISRLGYYYDDWYMLWSGASRGPASLVGLFSMDRPFMGVIYSFFYRYLRQNIIGWHLATLLVRIAGGIAFYWILRMAWPRLKSLFILAAMIFVVFPGFLAEPNAATKINHLIGYGAALFSIAFTLQAAITSSKVWRYACIALSLLLMALYVWIYEYMVGLEVMRVTLLYWLHWQGERERWLAAAKKVVLAYIPYVLVAGLFLYWRVFIFESTRDATDLKGLVSEYQNGLVGMALRLIFQVVSDFFSASIFAWFVQPYHLLARAAYGEIALALVVALVVVLLAVGFIYAVRKWGSADLVQASVENTRSDAVSPFLLIAIGALIVLAAVSPVVASNRHLDLMDPYKSYALHPSAGAVIILIGIVAMIRPKLRNTVMLAVLGLSVATQLMNIQQWANFWDLEKGMWWQLTWRAPDIQNDTLVMAYLPDAYLLQQDYEIWGPVNLIYRKNPENYPPIQAEVLNPDTVFDVSMGRVTDPHVRDIFMPRNFKNLLLISQPTTKSCIHVIDGAMPAYSASERSIVQRVGGFSDINRIDASATSPVPPKAVFGQEPEHGWCYYYQQASLARQVGDWGKIGTLYDSATSTGLKAGDASEDFVFIEGLVNLGRDAEAKKLATSALMDNDPLKYSLCSSLAAAPKSPATFGYQADKIASIVCK